MYHSRAYLKFAAISTFFDYFACCPIFDTFYFAVLRNITYYFARFCEILRSIAKLLRNTACEILRNCVTFRLRVIFRKISLDSVQRNFLNCAMLRNVAQPTLGCAMFRNTVLHNSEPHRHSQKKAMSENIW